jgi:hypothetical protein
LIWKTKKENTWLLRYSLHVLPGFDSTQNREILFLIDGQQRLSVLHQVRRGESIRNSNGREIRFGDVYFSLADEEDRFLYLKRPDPQLHLKVSTILSEGGQKAFRRLPAYKRKQINAYFDYPL